MHGQHVPVLNMLDLSFFGSDDLVEQNLVLRIDLGELFLRTVTIGPQVAFVEEGHIL